MSNSSFPYSSSPRERGPIRRVLSDWAVEVITFRRNDPLWLWVPAFAGKTLSLLRRLADHEDAA